MKAIIPRAWETLSPVQKKHIENYCQHVAREAAMETAEKDARIILDLYIKMACVILHDAFQFDEDHLVLFLGNHRRTFTRQRKMVANNTQIDYLNQRMSEIFPKNGFPKHFFDKMLGEIDGKMEDDGCSLMSDSEQI